MKKEATILNQEIVETPVTQEVVSEVVEKKEDGEKTKEVVEETKKEFLKANWPLSYKETKKMEKEFAETFLDLTPQGVLKTLQENMPNVFKDSSTIEDVLSILKKGKDGDDENLELGKNENLYYWLKGHIQEKDKNDHIHELKQELAKEKKPIVEQILKSKEEHDKKHRKEHEKEEIKTHKKSESKLWKTTKNVINRPLEHTWLGKYLIKKPIDWIKKLFIKK